MVRPAPLRPSAIPRSIASEVVIRVEEETSTEGVEIAILSVVGAILDNVATVVPSLSEVMVVASTAARLVLAVIVVVLPCPRVPVVAVERVVQLVTSATEHMPPLDDHSGQ